MGENMRENGKTTTWKELESMFGTMVVNMKGSTVMIKSMVLEFILGLMAGVMKDIGTKVNNMELVLMKCQKTVKLSMVFGKMVRELSGLMRKKCRISTPSEATLTSLSTSTRLTVTNLWREEPNSRDQMTLTTKSAKLRRK